LNECDSKLNFTPEQETAINHRGGSLLVSAAAGSGKTKVLVERLLSLIDEGYNIDEFLIITYTRAAAFELRERIHEELLERLSAAPGNMRLRRQSLLCRGADIDTIHTFCSQILRDNAHLVGLPPDFRVIDESESDMIKNEVLDNILNESYDRLSISLSLDNHDNEAEKHFGIDALIDTVIDGRDDKRLSEIILDIHRRIQSTPDPKKWLSTQIASLQNADIAVITQSDCGKYLFEKLKNTVSYCREEMRKLSEEMENHPEFEKKYRASVDVTISQIEVLFEAFSRGWNEASRYRTVEFPRALPIPEYTELKAIRLRCNDELKRCAAELENSSEEHIKDMRELAPALSALLNLVSDFDKAYAGEKRRRSAADFSDLEHLTLSLLTDKDTGVKTELAKSISKRFKEIMVDEYQDVNSVQELIFNAVSQDNSNIFMVGDVKQSIYRFRLADPSIFLSKYEAFEEKALDKEERDNERGKGNSEAGKEPGNNDIGNKNTGLGDITGTKVHLSKNFRSCDNILEAVNRMFTNTMSVELGEMEYTDSEKLKPGRMVITQKQGKQGKQGLGEKSTAAVEVDILSMSQLETTPEEESPAVIQIEAMHVASRISDLIANSYMIPDGDNSERPLRYSDIVILTRSVKGVAWRFAAALAKQDIPASFAGGEGFFESVEIMSVISLLSVIDNPMQDIDLVSVLSGPVYRFTSNELAQIRALSSNTDFYGAIKGAAEHEIESDEIACKCKAFLNDIEEYRSVSADMPADRFIWHVYNKTALLGLVSNSKNSEKRRSNLILLAEYARKFELSGYKGLFGFLTYVRGLQSRGVDLTEGIDAKKAGGDSKDVVRIMSIHKAKGLEFPVVFLVNTTKRNNYQDLYSSVVFHKDLGVGSLLIDRKRNIKYSTLNRSAIQHKLKAEMMSEELRVLYVAMTRAREKLIITAAYKDSTKKMDKITALVPGPVAPQILSGMSSSGEWLISGLRGCSDDLVKFSLIDINVDESESRNITEIEKSALSAEQSSEHGTEQSDEQCVEPSTDRYTIKGTEHSSGDKQKFETKSFDFNYPYEQTSQLPSKLTVTGLKKRLDAEAVNASWTRIESDSAKSHKQPVFISRKDKLTPTERGNLIHYIMQHIDYNKCSSDSDIWKELQSLDEKGIVESEDISENDVLKIVNLFKSDIGMRIARAKDIKREFKFSLLSPAEDYFPGGGQDKILLQGVVDCFFEESGELVVVDFKTDSVSDKMIDEKDTQASQRAKQYAPQLKEYAKALERITGKSVKERIIYFFETDTSYQV